MISRFFQSKNGNSKKRDDDHTPGGSSNGLLPNSLPTNEKQRVRFGLFSRRSNSGVDDTASSTLLPTTYNNNNNNSGNKPKRQMKPLGVYNHSSGGYSPMNAPSGSSPCTSFLMGGTYYPGKDKRLRNLRQKRNRGLCYRIFLSSNLRKMMSVCIIAYALGRCVIVPVSNKIWDWGVLLSSERGAKGMPVLRDEELRGNLLDVKKDLKGVRRERWKKGFQRVKTGIHGDKAMETIKWIVPEWAKRNELKDEKKVVSSSDGKGEKEKMREAADKALPTPPLQTMPKLKSQPCEPLSPSAPLSITLLLQCTPDRIWLVQETCKRWTDPIFLTLYQNATFSADYLLESCPQLTIFPHLSEEEYYPINRLRNTGLQQVTTTHFIVLDVDFIPSLHLHDTIKAHLPRKSDQALVIPAYEALFNQQDEPPCLNPSLCQSFLNQNPDFIPSTVDQLRDCVKQKKCYSFQSRDNPDGHSTTNSKHWIKSRSSSPTTIPCFRSLRYEPYVALRHCPTHTPHYDERFEGYGKNKIEYIQHLRFLGFGFQVAPSSDNAFVTHFPHPVSKIKEVWNNREDYGLHDHNDGLYVTFLKELVGLYGSNDRVGLCGGNR